MAKHDKFVGTASGFLVRYWARHTVPPIASRYIGTPFHPIRPKILHMCAHRSKDTLWWRVSVGQLNSKKRVVRSWCARRVRAAFEEAFRQQGLNTLGQRLSDSSLGKSNLTGSMEVYISSQCISLSFEEIQKEANQLISELMGHESTQEKVADQTIPST
jgi:hypothetical protein